MSYDSICGEIDPENLIYLPIKPEKEVQHANNFFKQFSSFQKVGHLMTEKKSYHILVIIYKV